MLRLLSQAFLLGMKNPLRLGPMRREQVRKRCRNTHNWSYVHACLLLPGRKPRSGRVVSGISGQLPSNLFRPRERGKLFLATRLLHDWLFATLSRHSGLPKAVIRTHHPIALSARERCAHHLDRFVPDRVGYAREYALVRQHDDMSFEHVDNPAEHPEDESNVRPTLYPRFPALRSHSINPPSVSAVNRAKYARSPSTGPIRPAQNGARPMPMHWNEDA